ncbi:CCR4-NOT transcription complex subunit 9, partial [Mucuna pruriens]
MANLPQSISMSGASASASKEHRMASVEHLVLDLSNPDLRENALHELSKDLAPLLWNSFGTMAALLQEIVSIYPVISPPNLTPAQSNRVCNALALLQEQYRVFSKRQEEYELKLEIKMREDVIPQRPQEKKVGVALTEEKMTENRFRLERSPLEAQRRRGERKPRRTLGKIFKRDLKSSSRELMVSTLMEAKMEALERRMEEMGLELIESFTQQLKLMLERSHLHGGVSDWEDEGSNQEEGHNEKFVEKREERMRRLEVP